MNIDPTINAGSIIQIVAFAIGLLIFLIKRNTTLDIMSKELIVMQKDIKDLSKVITAMAVSEVKITNVEQDIREIRSDLRDLKHGKGFVKDSIDKEWGKS